MSSRAEFEPVTSIPAHELLIWEDAEIRASLLRGMSDVVAGRVQRHDDFLEEQDGQA